MKTRITDPTVIGIMIGIMGVLWRKQLGEDDERQKFCAANPDAKISDLPPAIVRLKDHKQEDDIEVMFGLDIRVQFINIHRDGFIEPSDSAWRATMSRQYYENVSYTVDVDGDMDRFNRDFILLKMSGAIPENE